MQRAQTPAPLLIVSSDGHVGAPVAEYRRYVDPQHRAAFDDWLAQYVPLWAATQPKDPALPETLSETYKREWMRQAKVAESAEGTWNPKRRRSAHA